jgi:hypothetical protein
MLSATVNGRFLSGFSIGSRHSSVVNISHLLFADDTLVSVGIILTTYVTCMP